MTTTKMFEESQPATHRSPVQTGVGGTAPSFLGQQQSYEREVRDLLAQHRGDVLIRGVLRVDAAIRRLLWSFGPTR